MVEIERLAHRGFWHEKAEKNSRVAFERAFLAGYGVETDLRDYQGTVVISHDPPGIDSEPEMTFEEFLALYRKTDATGTLALNIKADGLSAEVLRLLERFDLAEYFVFDMSIPDMLSYLKLGMHCFSRHSEFESPIIFEKQNFGVETKGIWLDSFSQTWYSTELIQNHLESGLDVCLVSPELHGRDPDSWWRQLRAFIKTAQLETKRATGKLSICTDSPNF